MKNQVHPYLFAIAPILAQFCAVAGDAPLKVMMLPLLIACALALLMRGIFSLLCQDMNKGALLASLFLVLFLTYGHLRDFLLTRLDSTTSSLIVDGAGLTASLLLIILVAIFIKRVSARLTTIVTITGAGLVACSLLMILICAHQNGQANPFDTSSDPLASLDLSSTNTETAPHICCLQLGGQNRSHRDLERLEMDNSDLLAALTQRGFYLASESHSYHEPTALSFASLLNLNQLAGSGDQLEAAASDRRLLRQAINNNSIMRALRPMGYRAVSFATGDYDTELHSVDFFLASRQHLDRFHSMVLTRTSFPAIENLLRRNRLPEEDHDRVQYIFDHICDATELGIPIFTFVHLTASDIDLIRVIDKLQTIEDRPLVIILQSIPGIGPQFDRPLEEPTGQAISIINAIFFSDQDYQRLNPRIAPANALRVVLNHYFETDLPIEEDI